MAKRNYEDDDGRVIAPMNVDGMPWYQKTQPEQPSGKTAAPQEKMTREERRAFLWGSLKAVLLVGGAFFGVYFLVILILYLAM